MTITIVNSTKNVIHSQYTVQPRIDNTTEVNLLILGGPHLAALRLLEKPGILVIYRVVQSALIIFLHIYAKN